MVAVTPVPANCTDSAPESFVPLIFAEATIPWPSLDTSMDVICGKFVPTVKGKLTGLEKPPPGSGDRTVTNNDEGFVKKLAGTRAGRTVELTELVGMAVRFPNNGYGFGISPT